MGGGDLNMKKHFHPLTMENLERVWKAEERVRKEREKVEELQKELHEERQRESFERQAIESGIKKKKNEKLDWMYSSQHQKTDTSEYLLGKRIDKNVEVMKEDEKQELAQGVVSTPSITSAPKAGDILAKVKEDPLFLIKKREEDNRRALVENPLKMRKMKELLQDKMAKEDKKKKKKKKKKREQSPDEHQKRKHRRDEQTDIHRSRHNRRRESSNSEEEERESHHKNKQTRRHFQRNEETGHSRRNRTRDHTETNNDSERRRRRHDSSDSQEDRKRTTMDIRSDRTVKNNDRRRDRSNSVSPKRNDREDRKSNYSVNRRNIDKPERKRNRAASSSDDDDDGLEAQRKAMMDNARWRQDQRSENVKRYKAEDDREEDIRKASLKNKNVSEEKASFIRKIESDSYIKNEHSSVEERIRRTIHSKQRTNADLNKKFTAR